MMLLIHKDIPHMSLSELENDPESVWVKVYIYIKKKEKKKKRKKKLLIMWHVGIVHLLAQVNTSNCLVISSIRSEISIKAINSPQFMF